MKTRIFLMVLVLLSILAAPVWGCHITLNPVIDCISYDAVAENRMGHSGHFRFEARLYDADGVLIESHTRESGTVKTGQDWDLGLQAWDHNLYSSCLPYHWEVDLYFYNTECDNLEAEQHASDELVCGVCQASITASADCFNNPSLTVSSDDGGDVVYRFMAVNGDHEVVVEGSREVAAGSVEISDLVWGEELDRYGEYSFSYQAEFTGNYDSSASDSGALNQVCRVPVEAPVVFSDFCRADGRGEVGLDNPTASEVTLKVTWHDGKVDTVVVPAGGSGSSVSNDVLYETILVSYEVLYADGEVESGTVELGPCAEKVEPPPPPTIWVELEIWTVAETQRIDPDGGIRWRFTGKPGAVALDPKFAVHIYDVAADGAVTAVPAEDVWFKTFSAATDGGYKIPVRVNGAAASGNLPARQGWGSHGEGDFAWDLLPYGPERHLVFELRMRGTDEATGKPFQNVACWDTKVTKRDYASDGVARQLNADESYTVRPGDTVAQIAKSFEAQGATIWSIMAANGLRLEQGGIVLIEPGQVLTVLAG